MALVDAAARVVATAGQLTGPTANLANTRALVVEPILTELGWDTTNLAQVARDWPLSGERSISYALRLNGETALFLETTPVDRSVDDPRLVDETLELVATAETRWCLLTNGLRYRLFKADDAVARDSRLLFDLELADVASDAASEAAENLALLSRDSVRDGSLELRGEEFYIDPRIRQALLELCRDPSAAFISAMDEAVGGPSIPVERMRASLGRTVQQRGRRQGGGYSMGPLSGSSRGARARSAAGPSGESGEAESGAAESP